MKHHGMTLRRLLMASFSLLLLVSCGTSEDTVWPSRVILFIGDGMGPEQVRAGAYYVGHPLSFESFPVHTYVTTYSANSTVTDSAAAATAIATGTKVNNGVLSLRIPGSGEPLATLLERAANQGMLTGLATTVYITHATPAAFAAHQSSRTLYDAIAYDYMNATRPNLLLGGGANGLDDTEAVAAGYTVVKNLLELESAPVVPSFRIAGLFGEGFLRYEAEGGPNLDSHPDLADMTVEALRLMESSESGFFLMVESGLIDQAAHLNLAPEMVGEVAILDEAVSAALLWAEGREDVLIIVTADHETGGISAVADNGTGVVPAITWTTTGHTSRSVDLYAWGFKSERLAEVSDNIDIPFRIFP
jgi:alkaline phosphatase